MGLFSKLRKKIGNELDKVKAAEQSQYPEEVDEGTIDELRKLGLLNDGTAHIESHRCNWGKDTKTNRRTENLSKTYAAETPTGKGTATKFRGDNGTSIRDDGSR